ncbi:aspartate carbamoyltransferase [Methanonatronarchaeum sp. AMET6-2]|uniref:aspartate carbamoyltransferase n=1 Tax=Methanonatronarchaeum sp. AMET6-2 TaxID=2933293 RepID=UPI001223AB04|nr:aspartate carbamoyltransferase [Methanonatronarchaeum sp. AMET6-2]RZN61748.1 MAG: aspartate carbamoyltransferase [Methanonatronarchaeia archaeon]UOY10094.1 aspartate carbamoyltransferase [Methanonatronarchaeum sp. AMET6-2]
MNFSGSDVISMQDFSKNDVFDVLSCARRVEMKGPGVDLSGVVLANLFFEPSTRTKLSFETAMKRLGGEVISIDSVNASSVKKGETLADTVRVIEGYADALVLRHPKEGAAKMASRFTGCPVINAGDGSNEHPTQTLTDLYTIWKEKGSIDGLDIVVMGDLKYGRTVHSLVIPLSMFDVNLYLVSPPQLEIRSEILEDIRRNKANVYQASSIDEVSGDIDVLYATRIQKERFADPGEYEKVSGSYKIDRDVVEEAGDDVILMHPLPRVDEISPEVDQLDAACYFEQSGNGVFIRMALLEMILGGGCCE